MLVIATRDFTVGPQREPVIRKGELRDIAPTADGVFWTTTTDGHLFGECRLENGWTPAHTPKES